VNEGPVQPTKKPNTGHWELVLPISSLIVVLSLFIALSLIPSIILLNTPPTAVDYNNRGMEAIIVRRKGAVAFRRQRNCGKPPFLVYNISKAMALGLPRCLVP